jgi:hypothetical protein
MNAQNRSIPPPSRPLRHRLDALDWPALLARLDADGFALTGPVVAPRECSALISLFEDDARFRRRIVMERFRFGVGDYAYFAQPLPPAVGMLREVLYARLAPLANEWAQRLGRQAARPETFPAKLETFLTRCHAAEQRRPTPLLLRYGTGGYNCLHQDLYGKVAFPLQATCFLSRPRVDYQGGEFLLVEQRPRQQSRGTVLVPEQGALVLFASAERPVPSKRGFARTRLRHGVSTIVAGQRHTLGIIFHDAA